MPIYKYEAVNYDGETVSARLDAGTQQELIDKLREKNLYPVKVEEVDLSAGGMVLFQPKVTSGDVAVFLRQLATLLQTGVPIIESLDIIRSQVHRAKLKAVVGDIYENIHRGLSFSDALKKHPKIFTRLIINMVESGEMSGTLDQVTERLATHYEKDEKIRKKVKSSMIYPMVLATVTVAVVIFMLVFVMPTFIGMFDSSGVELPAPTRALLAMSDFLRTYWYIMVFILGGIYLGVKAYGGTEEGRMRIDQLKLNIPVVKRVMSNLITARFARTVSTMLYSGVPLLDAMDNVAKVVGNAVAANDIQNARTEVRMGNSLAVPISQIEYMPKMLASMIKIGEESGALDTILDRTANFYEDEVETSLQQLVALFEPILILFMGLILGFIIISMMMPMFEMVNTIS
ncbi:MAG: hypothetical protein AVO33_00150 [delta proteobacterium ML8_F1]|nr:MAG: hypothetical protein AVO33_00150 [delta proteobacterium ML8_F1]